MVCSERAADLTRSVTVIARRGSWEMEFTPAPGPACNVWQTVWMRTTTPTILCRGELALLGRFCCWQEPLLLSPYKTRTRDKLQIPVSSEKRAFWEPKNAAIKLLLYQRQGKCSSVLVYIKDTAITVFFLNTPLAFLQWLKPCVLFMNLYMRFISWCTIALLLCHYRYLLYL